MMKGDPPLMKKSLSFLLVLVMCFSSFALAEDTVQTILQAGTTQAFSDASVSEEDLNLILQAGLSATSAINQQPWFFAVVTNQEMMPS